MNRPRSMYMYAGGNDLEGNAITNATTQQWYISTILPYRKLDTKVKNYHKRNNNILTDRTGEQCVEAHSHLWHVYFTLCDA